MCAGLHSARGEQPVVKVPRRTETGDAPGRQGATTENAEGAERRA